MKVNMNKFLLAILVFISGCAQLQHGQIQPVVLKDAKKSIYFTTCGGAVEDWASCYNKASDTCNKNYTVISKGDNSRGTHRDLTFQCKN